MKARVFGPSPPNGVLKFSHGLMLLFLAVLLLLLTEGPVLRGGLGLVLLCLYHLAAHRYITDAAPANRVRLHIGVYLLLCSLIIWSTTGEDESRFWLVYLLPVTLAASRLGAAATLATSGAGALLLFVLSIEPMFGSGLDTEELAEICSFSLSFVLIGALIQNYASQLRRRLEQQRKLNRALETQGEELKASLTLLSETQESLRRTERLAALGELSARLAHEIRNPLGIISSSVQMIEGRLGEPARARGLLCIVQEEIDRLNRLIGDFLRFGRPAEAVMQPTEIRALLLSVAESASSLAAERGVDFGMDCFEGELIFPADPDLLRQILLNLLLNALEATGPGGRVRLSAHRREEALELEVSDTGCGIAPEDRPRIFHPFFTTKESGTGLGLSNAWQMSRALGGELNFESTPGQGTVFCLRLPRKDG